MDESIRGQVVSAITCIALAGTLVYAGPMQAADYDAQFTAGVGRSDNIGRTATDKVEETFPIVGGTLDLTEKTRTVDADISLRYSYVDYLDDTFDNENVAAIRADVTWSTSEGRFKWKLQENFGRQLFDPFEPARPENWENINYFSTGPELRLFSAGRNSVDVSATYSNVKYEIRPYDNERVSGNVAFERELSESRALSLNVTQEDISFSSNSPSPDFGRSEIFLALQSRSGRGDLDVEMGYTELDVDGLDKSDGFLFRLGVTRELSPFSRLEFSGGTQFSDQGNIFRYMQDVTRDIDSIGDVTESGVPFRLNSVFASYVMDRARTNLYASTGWEKEDYEDRSDLNRTSLRFVVEINRELSRRFFAGLELGFYQREYDIITRKDDDTVASASFGIHVTPRVDVFARYSYRNRDSDTDVNSYTENLYFLNVAYTPRWAQSE